MSSAALRNLRMLTRYTAWADARLFAALTTQVPGLRRAAADPRGVAACS